MNEVEQTNAHEEGLARVTDSDWIHWISETMIGWDQNVGSRMTEIRDEMTQEVEHEHHAHFVVDLWIRRAVPHHNLYLLLVT